MAFLTMSAAEPCTFVFTLCRSACATIQQIYNLLNHKMRTSIYDNQYSPLTDDFVLLKSGSCLRLPSNVVTYPS